jgi:hypothetical protein
MPRVTSPKKNQKKQVRPLSARPQARRSVSVVLAEDASREILDTQLCKVIEHELIPTEEPQATVQEMVVDSSSVLVEAETQVPAVSVLDSAIQPGVSRGPKVVPIRFSSHDPSPYVVALHGIASKVEEERREPLAQTFDQWRAPSEDPIVLDWLAAEAADLYVQSIDPWIFLGQFTPGNHREAYQEQYGWWARVRAPFIRWEVRSHEVPRRLYPRPAASSLPQASSVANIPLNPAPRASSSGFFSRFRRRIETAEQEVVERIEDVEEAAKEVWQVPALVPRLHPTRVIIGFLFLLAVVSLPAGAVSLSRSFGASVQEVRANSYAALDEIKLAVGTAGGERTGALRAASAQFREAEAALSKVNARTLAIAQALPQTRDLYQSSQSLLSAGQKATEAGGLLSQGLERAMALDARHPDERLLLFATYADRAAPLLEEAIRSFQDVKAEQLPEEVKEQVMTLQTALSSGQESVRDLRAVVHFLITAVGHEHPRRYLLVFQNHAELRPTGGFMGSVAEITLDRGEVKRVHFPGGGPYDLRSQLLARVLPPEPLRLVASRWEFQDANWFPDFPTAAKKIRWFWSKSGQSTVDGVIAVNATMLEKVLAITGPIDLPEYGKTVTAENVLFETQKAVELEYDRVENKPKKFVGDLLQKVMERMKSASPEDQLRYLALLNEAFETKEIQASFFQPEEEVLAGRLGWSGRMKPVVGDALAVIGANIGGQKTDAVIQEQIVHEAEVQADGTIIDTLTITRQHDGKQGELFRGANNVEYLRIYVPQGAELLEADGFQPPDERLFKPALPEDGPDPDVTSLTQNVRQGVAGVEVADESGRTVFGGWVQLKPGSTSVTRFRYQLPFTVFDLATALADGQVQPQEQAQLPAAYLLLLTSQSGKMNRTIDSRLILPDDWKVGWKPATEGQEANPQTVGFQGRWDRDQVVAATLKHP